MGGWRWRWRWVASLLPSADHWVASKHLKHSLARKKIYPFSSHVPVVNGDGHIVAEIHPLPLLPGLLSRPLPTPLFLYRPQAGLLVYRGHPLLPGLLLSRPLPTPLFLDRPQTVLLVYGGHPLLPGLFSRPLPTPLFLDRPQAGLLVYRGRPLLPGRAPVPASSLEAEDPEVVGVVLLPVLAAALFSEAPRRGMENIVLGSSPRPKHTFFAFMGVKKYRIRI
jgi:hypothetical protein